MDPRFLQRHHDLHSSRYAPLPHLPPPPPPPALHHPPPPPPSTPRLHYPDAQIFHSPHAHHLPQPHPLPQHVPRLPPPCQPLPPRPLPPPPPQQQEQHYYNPTPSHFHINYARPPQDFVQSPRMVDRLNPRLPRRDDFREPSTVLSDTHRPATRPFHFHPGFDLDRNDGHLHQRLPIDKLRHEPQGSSRPRLESKDGFDPNKKDDNFFWGRGDENYHRVGHFLSNSDSTSRDLQFVSNSRNIESTLGDFDHRFGSVRDLEGYRAVRNDGGHDRQASRDIDDLLYEMGSSKTDDGEGVRISSVKREYNGLDERYNHNRGIREDSHEYSRTPWKQVQKKSAFLRIQMAKPNHRSRESEQLHYSGYFDKANSGSFRGKDQFVHSDHGMEEQGDKRGGSPVELDVSFKSNSLVAKAIVASSSSAVVSDVNMIPRYHKTRKVSDGDCSNSHRSKFSETAINLDGFTCAAKKISNSEGGLKQLEEKVTTSDVGNVFKGSSQPCSRRTIDSLGKSKGEKSTKGFVSDKDGTNVGSGRTAPKILKKKKVVKKVVKKAVNPQSLLSSSLQTKKRDEPAKTDSSAYSLPAALQSEKDATERLVTSDGMASRHIIDLQARTDRVSVLPEDGIAGRSLLTAAPHDRGVNSDRASATKIRKNWKSPTYPLGSLSCEGNRTNEKPKNNSVHLCGASNSDKELIKPLTEITLSDIGHVKDVSKQFNLGGLLLPLETDAKKEATRIVLPVKDNANSSVLSLEEIKAHKDISDTYITPRDTSEKLGVENCIHKSQENTAASSVGIRDTIRKQPFTNQFSTSLENTSPEGIHQTLVGSSTIIGFCGSKKTKIHDNHVYAGCLNHGRDTTWNSNNGGTSLEEKITLSNSGNISYTGKHTASSRAAISLENYPLERYPNDLDGARASEGKMHNIKKRRKMRTQSDFSNSPSIHVERVNDVVRPANALDATLDFSPAEVTVSGVGSLDIGSQPGRDGVSVLQTNSLADGFSGVKLTMNSTINNLNGTSPRHKRKREISSTGLAWSSPTLSKISEVPAGTTISCADMSLINNDDLAQSEEEAAISSMNNIIGGMVPCPNETTVFVDNALESRSSEAVGAARDVFAANNLKVLQQGVESFSSAKDPNARSPCPPGLGRKQKENSTPLMAFNTGQSDNMDIETSDEEKMDAKAAEDQGFIHSETQCKITSEPQSPDFDQRFSSGDMESDYPLVKDDLPSVSNSQSLSDDGAGFSSPNINDELMDSSSRTLLDMCSQETLSEVPSIVMLNGKASPGQISDGKVCRDDHKLNWKSVVEGGSGVSSHTASPQYAKQDLATGTDHSSIEKTVLLPSQDSKIPSHRQSLTSAESIGKTKRGPSTPWVSPGHSPFVLINSKMTGSSARMGKARTWHRTAPAAALPLPVNKPFSNSIPPKRQWENNLNSQSTSYIRKGNSLVRKPAPVASQHQPSRYLGSSVYQAIYSGLDEPKKSTEYHTRAGVTDSQKVLTLGIHTPLERPRTPPLPGGIKSSTQTAVSSGYNASSPLAEGPSGCSETTSDPVNSTEANNVLESAGDPLKISENLIGTSNNLESQTELNDRSMAFFNKKRMVYVKRKSNQLVATSNSSDLSVHSGNNNQAASDGYYKRRKNQLIRASLENQIKNSVVMLDDPLNSVGKLVPKAVSSRKFSMRRLHKVVAKTCKPVKSSLVWTLCGKQALKNDSGSLDHQKTLPYRFPWKRAAYCRSFMHNEVSSSNNSSVSMISRKLLLLRKRDTVYTRSINGFSLRKFKVLSVGGSSLKWSKSIERSSKKANEEATLAVAAVEKKKREQSGVACISSQTKNRNHSSRERIFRIGSLRYKMDSTKRTLQRITDDESTCSTSQSEKDAKKSYIPRRLVIGNDEYVRIGNGNQLIRDPKKRTRILASEKVRWSLHTARLRLARKKKYCQFFTRFGKCNKGDGKCPYIHDPSKIAVCTKFLNGLCSNPDCKLTHKVIPERMPDCSYFLRGLCTNRHCPYRHVNVNPKASTCEGFLRGYCASGNECRKKHSYVCPIFEATGTCPQGSKCKLHHPKSRGKGKKRKRLGQRKNARGRYFGSIPTNVSEPRTAALEKISTQNNDDILSEGKLADYISLDVSDEDFGESNDPISEQTFYESESSDEQLDDLDELIKPVRIMTNSLTT